MARTPAPPGPPPQHFRPPGASAPPPPLLNRNPTAASTTSGSGAGPVAVTLVSLAMLALGLVIGFFIGRVTEADQSTTSAPPLTSPSTSTSRPPGDTIPQDPSGPPAPPIEPGAPPSTDLDPSTIGSLDDPIPVGQAYILGLYEIEVIGAVRDAGQTLADFDPANPGPPLGSQHVLVELAVRFTDDDGLGNPASIPFFASDGTGRWNDIDARCGQIPDSILDAPFIEKGDEATGNVCFTVPADAVASLVLGTEGFSGPIYFALPE